MPKSRALVWLVLLTLWLLVPAPPASAGPPAPGAPPISPYGFMASLPETIENTTGPCSLPFCTYLPSLNVASTWVNTANREVSRAFYLSQYLSSENIAAAWTGNHASCSPGLTCEEFKAAVLRRINYFRGMAGVPDVRSLSGTYNQKAQSAALMMSVNGQLSHTPPSSWTCYGADGAQAAGSSNLFLGVYGPSAISGYIMDPGSGNSAAGHRRWILFPPTQQMGTGDIPPTDGYPPANALWVFDTFSPRPATREPYVGWPPPGYVPYQVVFARWSFSYPNADFTGAVVSMQSRGASLGLAQFVVVNGYGENTLVWTPLEAVGDAWPKPAQDTTYSVTVNNVLIGGQRRSFTYEVTVFDPTK